MARTGEGSRERHDAQGQEGGPRLQGGSPAGIPGNGVRGSLFGMRGPPSVDSGEGTKPPTLVAASALPASTPLCFLLLPPHNQTEYNTT